MKEFEKDRFSWLVKTNGVWVVRLEEKGEVGHEVVVDGKNRVVRDICEEFPLDLKVNILRCCGGKNERKIVVSEVRRLVLQRKKRKLIEVVELVQCLRALVP